MNSLTATVIPATNRATSPAICTAAPNNMDPTTTHNPKAAAASPTTNENNHLTTSMVRIN